MLYKSGVDRREQIMFPDYFDNYVGETNPVRVIDAFVESMREEEFELKAKEARAGASSYSPRSLLKLYIYGYANRIRSSRELEKATHRNIEVIWLMNKLQPDHWTINEFRKKHGKVLKNAFRRFHILCREAGLIGKVVALDSAFFKGSVNRSHIHTRAELEKSLQQVDSRIEQYLKELASADEQSDRQTQPNEGSVGVRQAIDQMQKLQQDLQSRMQQLESSATGQISDVDADSRKLSKGSQHVGGYMVQIAVEADHHLIVEETTMRSGSDHEQLEPMCKVISAAVEQPVQVLADGGYYSERGLKACEQLEGVDVLVPVKQARETKKGLYEKRLFEYCEQENVVVCPQGHKLAFKGVSRPKNDDRAYNTYYDTAACAKCPVRSLCTEGKYRKVHLSHNRKVSENMSQKMAENKALFAKRSSTVEHVFGTMKFWMGGFALMLRGHAKVSGEISLNCLCYNLKRAIKIFGVKELIEMMNPHSTQPAC